MTQWMPDSSPDALQARAALLARLRHFFAARQVMEVETPLLSPGTGTDVHLQALDLELILSGKARRFYLQTSPEFAMKRLLAAGSGAIYQICKAFRGGEVSRQHNPEFSILEWYRPGFSLDGLMDEVGELIADLFDSPAIARLSYREIFRQHLDIDPHTVSTQDLQALAHDRLHLVGTGLDRDDYLQQLLAAVIEPQLPEFCFVYDYPRSQAALAAIARDDTGVEVARRFELYIRGMELANGYQELTDAGEQRRRFEADLARRKARQLPDYPIDEKFLAALPSLPPCAGVALGLDRLLMLLTGARGIDEVLAFGIDRI